MSKAIRFSLSFIVLILTLAACSAPSMSAPTFTPQSIPPTKAAPSATPQNAPAMSETEAKQIASQSDCTQAGTLQDIAVYNPTSQTWWIDLKADKPNCNPACVVDVNTKKAEVNWRCTGALMPTAIPPTAVSTPIANMANPASVNCIQQGGQVVIQKRGDGGEYGVCLFEDNRQCEEWALLRGDCPVGGLKVTGYVTPAAEYCVITGGTYTITSGSNTPNETGTCTLKDGQVCDVNDYYNGQCTASTTTPTAQSIKPLPAEVCNDQAQAMAHALNEAEVTQANASLNDPVNGKSGTGCQATITGTGEQFKSPDAVIKTLDSMLKGEGWTEDQMLAAGGPTGLGAGYRKGDQMCMVLAEWQPDAATSCPQDQPISACEVKPEHQAYTITLNCGVEAQ